MTSLWTLIGVFKELDSYKGNRSSVEYWTYVHVRNTGGLSTPWLHLINVFMHRYWKNANNRGNEKPMIAFWKT